ncbi:type II toxin-antitoxin system RelE/ParE family toxin [Roseateles saccharophilus]|uniref:Plasmid stabilization system protein ParE n=1 Tax=Roseateles saccharophilus TaxID=304 RepID=A0A4R3UYN0_ROSSA|nr:type II toxin-antitoxin system RelE/ParE family toxin [Roseateles saccharophilus]MDG0835282.1 type II toxin-antitoxin system RelE/ParE family toxin [Roseateles saccharophilus]TCU96191.1 hypothetical protein EV671_101469 [Roseateles saccharophilus]
MSAGYRLIPTVTFQQDVERLEEHIIQRELASDTPDETCIFRFHDALARAMGILSFAPHTCRRCEAHREFRELIVPFGHGGCVVLFAIRELQVLLLAARDQHENDYR